MKSYKEQLAEVVAEIGLDINNDAWKTCNSLITQEVLDDAHSKVNEVQKLIGPAESRKCKTIERVKEKIENPPKFTPDFKINSDFLGFRINTDDINIIYGISNDLKKKIEAVGGVYKIRNDIKNGEDLTDIVLYSFGYIPSIGYLMEFQIGHPFAFYVFTQDSARRKNKDLPDLWDLYSIVHDKIMRDANYNPFKTLIEIYGTFDNIPDELCNMEVLN